MAKLKVLVCGAPLSTSGYGKHCRVILNALKTIEDKIDLYLMPYRFSNTSNTYENDEDVAFYSFLVSKFNPQMLGFFDISIQIGVPHEWKPFAKYNIGVTAGVETLTIPTEWIDQVNAVNKLITISTFSKRSFVNTCVDGKSVKTAIDIVHYPAKDISKFKNVNLDLSTNFNFLSVNQWAPRKNIETLISWFVQEFQNNEDVGLVLKTYCQSNSTPDFYETRLRIIDLLSKFPDRKCKVYFIHGDMKDEELNALFNDPRIKCYINNAHGEGFGLSMFDAACAGLPIVAPDFSGYKDYLYQARDAKSKLKPFFQRVAYDMNPVQQHHLMPGLIIPGMIWAYPQEKDFKYKIREVYKDHGRFKKQAEELKQIILTQFDEKIINEKYIKSIFDGFNLEQADEQVIEVD